MKKRPGFIRGLLMDDVEDVRQTWRSPLAGYLNGKFGKTSNGKKAIHSIKLLEPSHLEGDTGGRGHNRQGVRRRVNPS